MSFSNGRSVHVVLAVGAASIAGFLFADPVSLWAMIAWFLPMGVAAVVLAARTMTSSGPARSLFLLLLTGQLVHLVASAVRYAGPVLLGHEFPFPSPLDGVYFAAYAMYGVFLGVLLRRHSANRGGDGRRAFIDSLILTTAMSAVVWVGVIEPQLRQGPSPAPAVVALLHPGLTLLLLALAAHLATGARLDRRRPGLLLCVWLGAETAGALFYGAQSATGVFRHEGPLMVTWMVAYVALGAFAAHPGAVTLLQADPGSARLATSAHRPRPGSRRDGRLAVLLVAALVPLALGVVQERGSTALVVASAVTFILLTYRSAVAAGGPGDQRTLSAQLDEAARELEAQAREMERLALHDPVTGLGNRALLRQRAVLTGMRPENSALLLLDLDGFKEVNDSLGHAAGDALLIEVGQRIGGCVRTGDTVVRLGGDEFAILLPDSGRTAATATAERILGRLREPFSLDGTLVEVRGSLGTTLGTEDSDLDEMLRNADLAMYEAKAGGRDQAQVFHPAMHQRAVRRLQGSTDMRDALVRGEFTVYYQPIVSATSGAVLSLEALVRWDHPQRGVVPPFEFVPDAERNGLIVELGRFVLATACNQILEWRADWPGLNVAVNVSQRELLHPDFATHVAHVLSTTGLAAHALHLEITETVLAAENDITSALESLAALGVEFSIDDFGTGHSSLSRLRTLPVDRLKIDKSFIAEITDDGTAPLLGSIIGLAHSLGRTVVAEGVETPEQATFLISNGCDELQGYLFGRPVAAPHVPPLLLGTRTPRHDGAAQPTTVFPPFIESLLEPTHSLDTVLPRLLAELTAISGLQTAFVTEVRQDPHTQITRFAHNADPAQMRIEEGLTVEWGQTLCRRMVEDGVLVESDVRTRYGDVESAGTLGIETYVSIPVCDSGGVLRGTLCAASNRQVEVRKNVIGVMQLFAQVLAERIVVAASPSPTAASSELPVADPS